MPRLEVLAHDQLTEDQLAVLDAINSGPRGGGPPIGLVGPFGVWVRAESLGLRLRSRRTSKKLPFALLAHTTERNLSSRRMPVLPELLVWTRPRLKTYAWVAIQS